MSEEAPRSVFWDDLERDMQDPEFRTAFDREVAKIQGMYAEATAQKRAGERARKVTAARRRARAGLTLDTKVYCEATEYEISIFPLGHEARAYFAVTVEYRGPGSWAVCDKGRCLDAEGNWDYESSPSSRKDDWLTEHRFDLNTALRLAQEAAPYLVCNRRSAIEVLAEEGLGSPNDGE